MSKPFPYWVRLATVTSLAVTITFQPVFAGRFLNRWLNRNCGCQVEESQQACSAQCECVVPTASACAPVVQSLPNIVPMQETIAGSTGCSCNEGMVVPSAPAHGSTSESTIVNPPMIVPSTPSHSHTPNTRDAAPSIPSPPQMEPKAPSIPKTESAPLQERPQITPKSDDDLFGNPPKSNEPAEIPATPPTNSSPANPKDDLFGSPTAPATTSEPAPMPTAPVDDPFGNPAPTPAAPSTPSTPVVDDLFGTPTEPAVQPNAPANDARPVDANPFGSPTTSNTLMPSSDALSTPSAPATANDLFDAPVQPEKPAVVDDLFGQPATEPAKETVEDLFGGKPITTNIESFSEPMPFESSKLEIEHTLEATQPEREISPETSAVSNSLDELFGAPDTKVESTIEATNPATPNQPADDSLESLFDSAEDIFKGAEFKLWRDNTGSFAVQGRLEAIFPDKIRILKDNGKYTTVPFRRLSTEDKQYVQWVAVQLSQPNGHLVSTASSAEAESN